MSFLFQRVHLIVACVLTFSLLGTSQKAYSQNFRTTVNAQALQAHTLRICPLHDKKMHLNDNYRPEGDTIRELKDYPFAYQLGFRRYCRTCTRVLHKEIAAFEKQSQKQYAKSMTFDRCALHNADLKGNKSHNPVDYVREQDKAYQAEYPHAQQYRYKFYCARCTKDYRNWHRTASVKSSDGTSNE